MSAPEIRLSDRLRALPGYPLAELPAIKRRLIDAGVDVIDLGAGDNDTPPPAVAVEAMAAALDDPAYSKYGFQQGLPEFRRAASDWIERRFAARFDPATELLPLIGSKEGLSHLPLAVANPGDVAIVPEPGYQAYLGGSMLAGAEPYVAPLRAEDDFLLRFDRIPESVLRRTKVAFVNYPNNPTAAVASRDYLAEVVAVCRKYGIVLAYDNAYCELTFDDYRAPSVFEIAGARDVALEFFSLSKSYSMTGWRLGFAAGRAELIGALTRIKTYVDTGPFLAVQKAGSAALDHSEELVAPIQAELTRRRDAAARALRAAGFTVQVPKAAMYFWIPLPAGVASARFAREALQEQGVVVLPGSAFGPAGEGFFRIALTVGADRLEAAAERLGRALESVRQEAGSLAAAP
jgi:LL-diaminopimelate aminotransferase